MTPIGFKMVILDSFQPFKMKIFGFLLSMLNISMVVSGKTFNFDGARECQPYLKNLDGLYWWISDLIPTKYETFEFQKILLSIKNWLKNELLKFFAHKFPKIDERNSKLNSGISTRKNENFEKILFSSKSA